MFSKSPPSTTPITSSQATHKFIAIDPIEDGFELSYKVEIEPVDQTQNFGSISTFRKVTESSSIKKFKIRKADLEKHHLLNLDGTIKEQFLKRLSTRIINLVGIDFDQTLSNSHTYQTGENTSPENFKAADDARAVLEGMKAQSDCFVFIATRNDKEPVEKHLKAWGVVEYFRRIKTVQDLERLNCDKHGLFYEFYRNIKSNSAIDTDGYLNIELAWQGQSIDVAAAILIDDDTNDLRKNMFRAVLTFIEVDPRENHNQHWKDFAEKYLADKSIADKIQLKYKKKKNMEQQEVQTIKSFPSLSTLFSQKSNSDSSPEHYSPSTSLRTIETMPVNQENPGDQIVNFVDKLNQWMNQEKILPAAMNVLNLMFKFKNNEDWGFTTFDGTEMDFGDDFEWEYYHDKFAEIIGDLDPVAIVKMILEMVGTAQNQTELMLKGHIGQTPLQFFLTTLNVEAVDLLIQAGVDINEGDNWDKTAMQMLIENCHRYTHPNAEQEIFAMIDLFIQNKFNFNCECDEEPFFFHILSRESIKESIMSIIKVMAYVFARYELMGLHLNIREEELSTCESFDEEKQKVFYGLVNEFKLRARGSAISQSQNLKPVKKEFESTDESEHVAKRRRM